MKLTDFQWSRNPRGMHTRGVFDYNRDIGLYRRTNMGWIKLVVGPGEPPKHIDDLFAFGVTPVVRVFLPRIGSAPMTKEAEDAFIAYAQAGVKWFEYYNEPNLDIEWPIGTVPDWRRNDLIAPLMNNWLSWAEFIIRLGGYPGFIALAESSTEAESAVRWMDAMINYLANNHYARFLNVLRGGCYCATHPYILNHYYQEQRGGGAFSARPPGEQRADERGWHFEYPYDPISQRNDPGRTVYGGTALTPHGDPNGLIAMGRMFNERCRTLFGTQAIPVLGTEGGIWDFPAPGDGSMQQDTRFPPYTNASHAEATVAMFDWIAQSSPVWMFGVCLWKEDIYLEKGGPTLTKLEQTIPAFKSVPAIDVMLDGSSPIYGADGEIDPASLKGPGPIHGQADFHVIVLDDSLSPDWFFETARDYWETFRPVVTTQVEFFDWLAFNQSLAVTLIISEDRQFEAEQQIRQLYPNTYIDSIVVRDGASLGQVSRIFGMRVSTGLRFG